MPPVKKVNTFSALNITEPAPGVFVFDFGQNVVRTVTTTFFKNFSNCYCVNLIEAGFCTLHLDQSGPAGSNLTIVHAEMMSEDGFIQHRYGNSPERTM